MIKGLIIKEDKKTIQRLVKYHGETPTYRDVLNYCEEQIDKIETSEDFKVLCYLYKKIKTKYENQNKKLKDLKATKAYLKSKENLDNLWGD